MREQHIDPAEAVAAHQILGAEKSIAMHFATFRLADKGQHTPARDLARARERANIDPAVFVVPAFGESTI